MAVYRELNIFVSVFHWWGVGIGFFWRCICKYLCSVHIRSNGEQGARDPGAPVQQTHLPVLSKEADRSKLDKGKVGQLDSCFRVEHVSVAISRSSGGRGGCFQNPSYEDRAFTAQHNGVGRCSTSAVGHIGMDYCCVSIVNHFRLRRYCGQLLSPVQEGARSGCSAIIVQ